ncbi:MAG: PDZ domain-containing protein, partial [Actinomycetota bacterium]|nr:PDZ domain-containing protein [Actinomycetota bacterium]
MSARPAYGSSAEPAPGGGGVVARVEPGSPAARAGVRPAERILRANGRVLTDVIAWWWESDGASVTVTIAGSDDTVREVVLARDAAEPWGIDFATALFDEVRTCRNTCAFCFMAQLPRGLRRALYVRDDDFRLSFLSGNFITLTNLGDHDVARITGEHLSPLHVSLHAVTPAVRERLVCAREDRALIRFDELIEGGIDLHVQIVLVPGENDGAELEATLTWLAEREGVLSVGIVPLGYTAHQQRFS